MSHVSQGKTNFILLQVKVGFCVPYIYSIPEILVPLIIHTAFNPKTGGGGEEVCEWTNGGRN